MTPWKAVACHVTRTTLEVGVVLDFSRDRVTADLPNSDAPISVVRFALMAAPKWQVRWRRLAVAIVGCAALLAVLNLIPTIHDPTEGTRVVHIVNDSQEDVRLGLCEDRSCSHLAAGTRLVHPGDSYWQNAAPNGVVTLVLRAPTTAADQCVEFSVGAVVPTEISLSKLNRCSD